MNKNCRNAPKILTMVVFFCFLVNMIVSVISLVTMEIPFMDFHARWQECAYFLRGINPFKANMIGVIPEIGQLDDNMVTVPWAWLMGMFINPGFLPYKYAKIVGVIILTVVFLVTLWFIYRLFEERKYSGYALAAMIFASQFYWWWAVACGNHGMYAVCLVIIAICIYEKKPIFAGVLMAIAMIKPQLAAIFYIVFLLKKQYKLIVSSLTVGGYNAHNLRCIAGDTIYIAEAGIWCRKYAGRRLLGIV